MDIRVGTVRRRAALPGGAQARRSSCGSISAARSGSRSPPPRSPCTTRPDQLIGRQVCAVVNFPPRQIGPLRQRGADARHAGRRRGGGAGAAGLHGPERRAAVLMATHYYTVTWDQLHRDARALAWRLMEQGAVRRHRRGDARRSDPGGDHRARAGRAGWSRASRSSPTTRRRSGQPSVTKTPAAAGDGEGFLIVDDLVDTGATARVVRALLPRAHFACIYAKPAGGRWWTPSSPRCRRTPGSCFRGTPSPSSLRRWSSAGAGSEPPPSGAALSLPQRAVCCLRGTKWAQVGGARSGRNRRAAVQVPRAAVAAGRRPAVPGRGGPGAAGPGRGGAATGQAARAADGHRASGTAGGGCAHLRPAAAISAAISGSASRCCNCAPVAAASGTNRTSQAAPRGSIGRRSGGGTAAGVSGRGAARRRRAARAGSLPSRMRPASAANRTAIRRSRDQIGAPAARPAPARPARRRRGTASRSGGQTARPAREEVGRAEVGREEVGRA